MRPAGLLGAAVALVAAAGSGCAELASADAWPEPGATATGSAAPGAGGGGGKDASSGAAGDGGVAAGGAGTYVEAVLQDDPIAYWRLGEASGEIAIDQQMMHHGHYDLGGLDPGQPGAIDGDPDKAVGFGGREGRMQVADDAEVFDFPGTDAFSIELWVKPARVPDSTYRFLVHKRPTPYDGYALFLHDGEGLVFERYARGTAVQSMRHMPGLTPAVFSHVVVTCGRGIAALFVNGTQQQTVQVTDIADTSTELTIGANAEQPNSSNEFSGVLDEVAVYGHALDPARILLHHKVGTGLP